MYNNRFFRVDSSINYKRLLMSLNIQETIFKANDIIGVDEVGPGVREVTVAQLLFEGKMIGHAERDEALANNYDMSIEWMPDGDDIDITQIWNSTTGEIYREYNDLPENRGWTDGDELVVCSLLMWGELNNG